MLILASASPRRHELLMAAAIIHRVQPASVPEQRQPGESSDSFVLRLAQEKAHAVGCAPGDIVLAADTVVCLDGEMFGKPDSDNDARRMLAALSGRDHWVKTGICILASERQRTAVQSTKVTFATLSEQEIHDYIRSGEHRDKAGAYGIQGRASRYVTSIEGCYHNVVGLPVALVYEYLKTLAPEQF